MTIGVDLIEIERIRSLADNQRFLRRIYTIDELKFIEGRPLDRRVEWLAGRFAAKEATYKAFCALTDRPALSWRDVSVLPARTGMPIIHFSAAAQHLADALGVTAVEISLAHTRLTAVAVVQLTR